MPPFSYVPSTRVLRLAWTLVAVVFGAVFFALVWTAVTTALDLQHTNSRLDHSELQRRALIHRMRSTGFNLTFVTRHHRSDTYTCLLTRGSIGYTCRAR